MPNNVLLIEDTRSFSSLLKQLVQDAHGFKVDVVETLEEARETLASPEQDYFVAIVDLNLPDAPNGEAVELVVSHGVPAVVFTGVDDSSVREDLWSRGIADYAHKSGVYSLEYVLWVVNRLYLNRNVEVVVVDDSRVARKTMEKLLKVQNFIVHTADTGERALETIKNHPNIAIAIIDCYMDGMGGLDLTASLREIKTSNELEIIGVSSQGGQQLSAQFIKTGANDFLIKPFLPEELFCRVNRGADRIESYVALKELNQQKNKLLGTAAHDIRGPLGSIKTAANLILKRKYEYEKVESLVKMIERGSSSLLALLETMLDVSAIESGQTTINLSTVNFSEIVQERISLYAEEAKSKNIHFSTSIQSDLELELDEIKIKQPVDNLITNAIKYSPPDTEVSISLEKADQLIVFCVADHGPGIKEEESKNLFQAYAILSSQTTGGEKKTGLGLAIAKNIVEAHHGRIFYCHNIDGGSRFYFELPFPDSSISKPD